jgi:hypothetical protein
MPFLAVFHDFDGIVHLFLYFLDHVRIEYEKLHRMVYVAF